MRATPLIGAHRKLGAKLTAFAGWEMPLSFSGTTAEHRAVREGAGLFDLCHMGRFHLSGDGARGLLERVTPGDLDLAPEAARYTVILDGDGGIVDDVIITRLGDDVFALCVNAVNRTAVWDHLARYRNGFDLRILDESDDVGQIAVQGPGAPDVVRPFLNGPFPDFMHTAPGQWNGAPITVSRTGYTGEAGVELYVPAGMLPALWNQLAARVTPCGLGARDTLRLEMGYPLYGHELSRGVTPVEAGLSWVVQWEREGFLGREQLIGRRDRPTRRLIGLAIEGPGLPREGCRVLADGAPVGMVTSGNMGLSVGHGVALAHVAPEHAVPDTIHQVEVRGRILSARVARLPFYRHGTVRRTIR